MTSAITASDIYAKLLKNFGPQGWWPVRGVNPDIEVCVGAILTQNTSWSNVEKAISNLIGARMLGLESIAKAQMPRLAAFIRPSGYYNQKAERLRLFARHVLRRHGSLRLMFRMDLGPLREELLSLKGIGPETADSMILYAARKPVFVIDAYTRRICARLGLHREDAGYDGLQRFFHGQVKPDAAVYNEFHALFVRLAKEHCRKRKPDCSSCPLIRDCASARP